MHWHYCAVAVHDSHDKHLFLPFLLETLISFILGTTCFSVIPLVFPATTLSRYFFLLFLYRIGTLECEGTN